MNLYVCSHIISSIGNRTVISNKEEIIKDELNDRYFNEVEVYTQRYIEWEMEQIAEIDRYYNEHPELIEEMHAAWDAEENRTPTEKRLLSLNDYILGMSWDDAPIEELLKKLDLTNEQVKVFFSFKETKDNLKRNRRIRKSIDKVYGKKYLKNLWKN